MRIRLCTGDWCHDGRWAESVAHIILQDEDRTVSILLASYYWGEVCIVDLTSFNVVHFRSSVLSKRPPSVVSAGGGLHCINRCVSQPIFVHDALGQRERTFRPCMRPHGNLTPPRISPRRPPSLRRLTAMLPLQRSTLGLDASIIISSACRGLRCGCAAPSES